jgi:hypothetical protein
MNEKPEPQAPETIGCQVKEKPDENRGRRSPSQGAENLSWGDLGEPKQSPDDRRSNNQRDEKA